MTKLELLKAIEHITDWSYQYSDDHNAWKKGREQAQLLANLGITIDDLMTARLDKTFFAGVKIKEDYKKPMLINDVFYKVSFYINTSENFVAAIKDKNEFFISSNYNGGSFDTYIKEHVDDSYANTVFKILWRNR